MVSMIMMASKWYLLCVVLWNAIHPLHNYNLGLPKNGSIMCYNDLYDEYAYVLCVYAKSA